MRGHWLPTASLRPPRGLIAATLHFVSPEIGSLENALKPTNYTGVDPELRGWAWERGVYCGMCGRLWNGAKVD